MTSAVEHSQAAEALGAALRGAGYTKAAIERATSAGDAVLTRQLGAVAAWVQTDRDDPLAVLVRLFSLGGPERRDRVDRVLPDLPVDDLVAAGVMEPDGDRVRSLLRVAEADGVLAASDLDQSREDWVIGVSPSTMLAATHVPRVPAARALDVGTGQGLQALLAARHCDHVVATDFNPRALWMTAFNAQMNRLDNIETRQGSFFEPVEGERFDLVVANPPYVISPEARYLYRDGGFEGDGLCRTMLADLPRFLNDGGFATLECNWIHGAGEKWFAPIERALTDSGCDAVMARIMTAEPLEYAATWNEPHHHADTDGYERVVREWVEHFGDSGIERVSSAMVVLRRRPAPRNWRRAVSLARHPERLAGARLAAQFEAQDKLEGMTDAELLATPLRTARELRVERYERPGQARLCVLDLDEAVGVRRPVPAQLADLVLEIDGSRPLGAIDGAAEQVDGVRALLKLGFLSFA